MVDLVSFWQVSYKLVAFASQSVTIHHRSMNLSTNWYFVFLWMFYLHKHLPFHASTFLRQAKKPAPYNGAICSRHCSWSNLTLNTTDLILLMTSLQNPKTIQLWGRYISNLDPSYGPLCSAR